MSEEAVSGPVLHGAPADGLLGMEAPGDVILELPTAGLGTRFIAALVDHLLAFILMLAAASTCAALAMESLLIVMTFALLGGYIMLEVSGRSPGKLAVGLRVVRLDGGFIRPRESFVRNVVRIVDFLPSFYLLGVVVMVLDPLDRRLGDLLAGTVVVRGSRHLGLRRLILRLPYRERPVTPEAALARVTLTAREHEALRAFSLRTRTLPASERLRLGRRILQPLYRRAGVPMPEGLEQEQLLVDLLHRENRTFGVRVTGIYGDPGRVRDGGGLAPPGSQGTVGTHEHGLPRPRHLGHPGGRPHRAPGRPGPGRRG